MTTFNACMLFANIEKAIAYVEKGFGPVLIGGNREEALFGALFEDKFVLSWALGAVDEEGNPLREVDTKWVEKYTIHKEDEEAWKRLLTLCKENCRKQFYIYRDLEPYELLCSLNWKRISQALKLGQYEPEMEFHENVEAWAYAHNDGILDAIATPTRVVTLVVKDHESHDEYIGGAIPVFTGKEAEAAFRVKEVADRHLKGGCTIRYEVL